MGKNKNLSRFPNAVILDASFNALLEADLEVSGDLISTSATFKGNVVIPNTVVVGVGESWSSPFVSLSGQRDTGVVETNTMRFSVLGDGTMRFEGNRSTDGIAYEPVADLSQLGLYLYNSAGTFRGRLETQNITGNRAWIYPDFNGTIVLTEGVQTINGAKTLTEALTGTSATFSGTINLATTTSSTLGVLNQNSTRLLHTSNPAGSNHNLFLGYEAGNFTNNNSVASNIGIGTNALQGLTTGTRNIYIGSPSGSSITSGSNNTIVGAGISGITIGSGNTIIGYNATPYGSSSTDIIELNSGGVTRIQFNGSSWTIAGATTITGALTGTSATFSGNLTVGQSAASTNRYLSIDGVSNKASAIRFLRSGTTKWFLGDGAASENNNFELYNALGTIVWSVDNSTSVTTFGAGIAGTSATFSGTLAVGGSTLNSSPDAGLQYNGSTGALFVRTNGQELYFTAVGNNYIGNLNSAALNLMTNNLVRYTIDASGNNTWTGNGIFTTATGASITLRYTGNSGFTQLECNAANELLLKCGGDGAEAGRFTASRYFKASNDGTYVSTSGPYHELRSDVIGAEVLYITSKATSSPYGASISFTGSAPNNATSYFLYAGDTSGARFKVMSDGGVYNFSANNVNLSDRRTKKDIKPVASMWETFKAIEIVDFKYKDQTHNDNNLGVIAQQVLGVAPRFVDVDGFGEIPKDGIPLMSVYDTDIQYGSIKALQEAIFRIEELEAEVKLLKAK